VRAGPRIEADVEGKIDWLRKLELETKKGCQYFSKRTEWDKKKEKKKVARVAA